MRICIIGKFPPIQGGVSMRTYWNAHAPCRARARGARRHQCQGGASRRYRMYMRTEDWQQLRGDLWRRLGDGALDRSGRPLAVLHSDGQPVRLASSRPSPRGCMPSIRSTSSIRIYLEPYGVAGHLAAQMTGVPHVDAHGRERCRPPVASPPVRGALRPRAALRRGRDRGRHGRRARDRSAASRRTASPMAAGSWCRRICSPPDGPALDLVALRAEVGADSDFARPAVGRLCRPTDPTSESTASSASNKGSFALLAAMQRLKHAGLEVGLVALAHGPAAVEKSFRTRAREARPRRPHSTNSVSSSLARA